MKYNMNASVTTEQQIVYKGGNMETCLSVKLRNDVEKIQTTEHFPCHNCDFVQ